MQTATLTSIYLYNMREFDECDLYFIFDIILKQNKNYAHIHEHIITGKLVLLIYESYGVRNHLKSS